ncbi:MAG: FAD-dependent oxidoreductase [Deltaproteobacteria bacterium]|nr:FAD-dependent oxidoreductase [Deltaproteobacteria bacterium]
MRVVIVGGVAGGATAAARLRRLSEDAEIVMFERGPHVSFASCGVPYRVGGRIPDNKGLVLQTPESLAARYALDVRVRHEVVGIKREQKRVTVRDLETDRVFDEPYDLLLLTPGARPLIPNVPGARDRRVLTVRTIDDSDRILALAKKDGRAVVIGGGFVGVEIAENLVKHGLAVTLVEALPQVLGFLDAEMAGWARAALVRNGVEVVTSAKVVGFDDGERFAVLLEDGRRLEADLAVSAIGVVPEVSLARDAGLAVGPRGGIVVDSKMRTNDPAIFAVGDAVEVEHAVLGTRGTVPLAGPANRQARVAADVMAGLPSTYAGALGTSIVRAFDVTLGATGASARQLRQAGIPFRTATAHATDHVSWFPGATEVHVTLHYSPDDGRLLGAQVAGEKGVDKRIDVLATAIRHKATVHDLIDEELAYAPPFGAPKDVVNLAGMVASNDLRGLGSVVDAEAAKEEIARGAFVLDVRTRGEHGRGAIEGSTVIPVDELRHRLDELPRDRTILVHCAVGRRGYVAQRVLLQHGFRAINLTGGYTSWKARWA